MARLRPAITLRIAILNPLEGRAAELRTVERCHSQEAFRPTKNLVGTAPAEPEVRNALIDSPYNCHRRLRRRYLRFRQARSRHLSRHASARLFGRLRLHRPLPAS